MKTKSEKSKFSYVTNSKIRTILEEEYKELNFLIKNKRSLRLQLILIGALLEGVLYENLMKNRKIRKDMPELSKRNITLNDLLVWARNYEVISNDLFRLSEPIRDYRNLIHPNVYNRTKIIITKNKLDIGLGVLLEVISSMSAKLKSKDDISYRKVISSILKKVGRTPTESDFSIYIPFLKKYGNKNGIKMIKLSIPQ